MDTLRSPGLIEFRTSKFYNLTLVGSWFFIKQKLPFSFITIAITNNRARTNRYNHPGQTCCEDKFFFKP